MQVRLLLSKSLMAVLLGSIALWVQSPRAVAAVSNGGFPGQRLTLSKLQTKWQTNGLPGKLQQPGTTNTGTGIGGNNRLPNRVEVPDRLPPPTAPPSRQPVDISRGVLLDCSAQDENWPDLRGFIDATCQTCSLPVKTLTYNKDTSTLVEALRERPALLIVGSCRDFSADEAAMVAQYVSEGGLLLVLPQGTAKAIPRAAALNKLMSELGIAVTYGRPGGQAHIHPHPATVGLTEPLKVTGGCSAWAYGLWPVVSLDQHDIVSYYQFGQGFAMVFDGNLLRTPAGAKTPAQDTSLPFKGLFRNCVRWLVGC
jgi:hypothetical protein